MSTGDATTVRDGQEEELHPTRSLDDTVHQRVRLGVLAIAREADRVEFGFLKRELGVTDGNLSRHLKVLEESTLITVEKGYAGRRPRTWITSPEREPRPWKRNSAHYASWCAAWTARNLRQTAPVSQAANEAPSVPTAVDAPYVDGA